MVVSLNRYQHKLHNSIHMWHAFLSMRKNLKIQSNVNIHIHLCSTNQKQEFQVHDGIITLKYPSNLLANSCYPMNYVALNFVPTSKISC